eukprot:4809024-Ditylum_brightwellii.AAC.1
MEFTRLTMKQINQMKRLKMIISIRSTNIKDTCKINAHKYKDNSNNKDYITNMSSMNININDSCGIGVDIENKSPTMREELVRRENTMTALVNR